MRMILAGMVVALASVSVATASGTGNASRCGPPSSLGTVPTGNVGPGIQAGPVWFVPGGPVRLAPSYPDAIYPRKVLIQAPKPPLSADLTLRGFKCGSGVPLRFWYPRAGEAPYPSGDNVMRPSSSRELRESGSSVAALYRAGHAQPTTRDGARTDYRGFILFSEPGTWKVVVRDGARVVGTAIFRVTAT
jgi:hypothetical protein